VDDVAAEVLAHHRKPRLKQRLGLGERPVGRQEAGQRDAGLRDFQGGVAGVSAPAFQSRARDSHGALEVAPGAQRTRAASLRHQRLAMIIAERATRVLECAVDDLAASVEIDPPHARCVATFGGDRPPIVGPERACARLGRHAELLLGVGESSPAFNPHGAGDA
jgi:hypothetical protein